MYVYTNTNTKIQLYLHVSIGKIVLTFKLFALQSQLFQGRRRESQSVTKADRQTDRQTLSLGRHTTV